MMIIGILPTLTEQLLNGSVLSANPRYKLLNEQIFAARGEDLEININGVERLAMFADTIAPEAACTSVQLHQMIDPARFGAHWNAAQAIAGFQMAIGANSPFFFGRELWRETRIALFEQTTDTRPGGAQGPGRAPARVVRRALDHVDLRPLRGERPLLPGAAAGGRGRGPDGGPGERRRAEAAGAAAAQRDDLPLEPPIYDISRGRPHLRVENRVLPAGPTIVDTLANAAFYYGLVRVLVEDDRPVWSSMSFDAAARELLRGRAARASTRACTGRASARRRRPSSCCAGCCRWPATGSRAGAWTPPTPTACSRSSSTAASSRSTARPGRPRTFHRLYDRLDRADALREMTVRYREHMHSNEPVHTWPAPPKGPVP